MRSRQEGQQAPRAIGRRSALRRLGGVALALGTSGCSRRLILRAIYPESRGIAADDVTRNLTAFVETVVPGVDRPERIAGLMRDPDLPFGPLAGVLVADLARRSETHAGHGEFDRLPPDARIAIIAEVLDGGGIPGRIYNGAVFFAQAAVYGGLASDDGSCAITGFEGPFRFRGFEAQTYPDPENFLPTPVSSDGNPW